MHVKVISIFTPRFQID